MDKDNKIADINKALSVNIRVKIIRLLGERTFCVGALSTRLGITPGAVSQHMRILKSAGVVVPEKRGYFVHYRLEKQVLKNWELEIKRLLND
jgi:DNA-binding transcriptional ArsR family regulator